jgi:hypothetical protein
MNYYDETDDESKATTGFRASMDLFMGIMYVLISGFCLLRPGYMKQFGNLSDSFIYIICGLFLLYGVFRVYRGWQNFAKAFLNKRDRGRK